MGKWGQPYFSLPKGLAHFLPEESVEVKPQQTCQNGENRPCSSEVGACQIGVEICENGVWGECLGAVFPAEEILDEVDNNCDGQVDEGLSMPEPVIEISTTTEQTTTTTP